MIIPYVQCKNGYFLLQILQFRRKTVDYLHLYFTHEKNASVQGKEKFD